MSETASETTSTASTGTARDTAPAPQVWPTLRARDALALIRFLVEAFGFEETVVYADGNQVHHAQLSWPEGGGIMLGSRGPRSSWSRTTPTTAPGISLSAIPKAIAGPSAPTAVSPGRAATRPAEPV